MPQLQRHERGRTEGAWPLRAWVELAKQVEKRRDCPPEMVSGFQAAFICCSYSGSHPVRSCV